MEIRQVKAHEMGQAIQLADSIFRNDGHVSMGSAFPYVFSEDLSFAFGAFVQEKLVSFMGVVPATICVHGARLRVFSIGAVCTDADYRNQGLSTALLTKVYEFIDQAQASLLLVSGGRGLYRRNGCYSFGTLHHYKLEKKNGLKSGAQETVREAMESDVFAIDQLRKAADAYFEGSVVEWVHRVKAGGFASIPKMTQTVYAAEKQGAVNAYAVVALPTKWSSHTKGIVIERGGDAQAVHRIMNSLLLQNTVPLLEIGVPWHDRLNTVLSEHAWEARNNGGTIHIVNSDQLVAQLTPYFYEKGLEVSQLGITEDEGEMIILTYKSLSLRMSKEQFVAFVFGLSTDGLPADALPVLPELQEIFPVPFPTTNGLWYV